MTEEKQVKCSALLTSPYIFIVLLFVFFFSILLHGQGSWYNTVDELQPEAPQPDTPTPVVAVEAVANRDNKLLPFALREAQEYSCDLFAGTWVRDELGRPLYQEHECPYIRPQRTCQAHGRPEKEYQFWRWQPNDCDLPSFNATLMLESLRGKRMMYVGDSLSRDHFISMVCLVHSIVPNSDKSFETKDLHTTFRAKGYNATIEFYWAPFLLESNTDFGYIYNISERIVRKGSMNKHGQHWKGVDIMVFGTYYWWMTGPHIRVLRAGSFQDEVLQEVKLPAEEAYAMGVKSMVRWVKQSVNMTKTRVFFTSQSPTHGKSADWGGKPGGTCYNETTMITSRTYWGSDSKKSMMEMVENTFRKSRVNITVLNITQLTGCRKEAHPSIYMEKWRPLTPEQLAHPNWYADCLHFCLPGLQDTWNELLFTKLFYP